MGPARALLALDAMFSSGSSSSSSLVTRAPSLASTGAASGSGRGAPTSRGGPAAAAGASSRRACMTVLVVDEIDVLITKDQEVSCWSQAWRCLIMAHVLDFWICTHPGRICDPEFGACPPGKRCGRACLLLHNVYGGSRLALFRFYVSANVECPTNAALRCCTTCLSGPQGRARGLRSSVCPTHTTWMSVCCHASRGEFISMQTFNKKHTWDQHWMCWTCQVHTQHLSDL